MTGSRAAHNSRLVKRHQQRQSNVLAKSSANRFTLKQSQFERKREEEQVQAQQQADTPWSTSRAVGDGLLSQSGHGRGSRSHTTPETEVRDTPNPFARGRSAHASGTFSTTTRSATMGLEKVKARSTRTTRRIDRFNLTTSADSKVAPSPSSLMGVRRVREGEGSGVGGLAADSEEGGCAAPPAKVTRAERFREMVSNSKGQRAQLQRERAERDATTVQLDAEINDLLHLLPKRNKLKDEQEAFAQSGTPEVRALLDSYRRNHQAKCLTLKSSGAFEVRTLVEAARGTTARSSTPVKTTNPTVPESATARDAAPSFLDAADRALLARIRDGTAIPSEDGINEAASIAVARGGAPTMTRRAAADVAEARAMVSSGGGGRLANYDDFDLMMHAFQMDPRRAHAVDRTLTEEEEAAKSVQQALLKEDRQQVPSLHLQERDQTQLTRGEWVAQGGDIAFHMDDAEDAGADDDNVDIPSSYEGDSDAGVDGDKAAAVAESGEDEDEAEEDAAVERVGGSATLDRLFEQLEQVATSVAEAAVTRSQRLHELLVQLHRYAAHHVVEVTKAFRLVLVEAERSFLRGTRRGGMHRSLLVYLYAISKLFPTSDYRHAVVTPFLLFLCSALMQMRLDSLEAVHSYLVLATLLLHCLKAGSGRFCAEVVVAALNVLALQLPRAAHEPARYQGTVLPIPLLERTEQALLVSSTPAATPSENDDGTSQRPPYQVGLFDTTHSPERLLLCAYHLLEEVCDLHRSTPAFPVMCARPLLALDALMLRPPPSSSAESAWRPSAAVRLAHEALVVKVRDMAKHAEEHRTPLAMRTFRPRPLRQFDPLLAEREENAVKNEVRLMKRDIREDKKRLIRHLTAEATVQRRAQEKRQAIDDALREKRYHNVMSQLQQQQHSMNVVESLKARAKSKSRKGLSGAPTTSSSAEVEKE